MSTTSSTEIQQLKEFISDRFNQLELKIDGVQADIKGLDRRLRDIELNQAETKGRMDDKSSLLTP